MSQLEELQKRVTELEGQIKLLSQAVYQRPVQFIPQIPQWWQTQPGSPPWTVTAT